MQQLIVKLTAIRRRCFYPTNQATKQDNFSTSLDKPGNQTWAHCIVESRLELPRLKILARPTIAQQPNTPYTSPQGVSGSDLDNFPDSGDSGWLNSMQSWSTFQQQKNVSALQSLLRPHLSKIKTVFGTPKSRGMSKCIFCLSDRSEWSSNMHTVLFVSHNLVQSSSDATSEPVTL